MIIRQPSEAVGSGKAGIDLSEFRMTSAPQDFRSLPSIAPTMAAFPHEGELQVRLLGPVRFERDGEPILAPSAKALELWCHLLLNRSRAYSREALAEELWPGVDPVTSRRYLRQALWRLNAAFRDTGGHKLLSRNPAIIRTVPDSVRVNTDGVWLDVHGFESAHTAFQEIPGRDLSADQASSLEQVVRLYRGELMEGLLYDWSEYERQRVELMHLALREKLMDYCERHQMFAAGVVHGQIILRGDPARESAHRRLMRLHSGAGDRTTAMRQYEFCVAALRREFGVQPSAETIRLHQLLRADRVWSTPADQDGYPEPTSAVGKSSLPALHARLDDIHRTIADLKAIVLDGHCARCRMSDRGG